MVCVIEIRSYNLKPGTRAAFHDLFIKEALPMLNRWNVEVVAYGPSLHDSDSYYLMRAYANLEDRQQSQDAFYGSEEWLNGPREPMIARAVARRMVQQGSGVILTITAGPARRALANVGGFDVACAAIVIDGGRTTQ